MLSLCDRVTAGRRRQELVHQVLRYFKAITNASPSEIEESSAATFTDSSDDLTDSSDESSLEVSPETLGAIVHRVTPGHLS